MTITRNVILDLLPLYLAGEVSEDTKLLVERFLAQDPELARLAREQGSAVPASPNVSPRPDLELQALLKTRRYLRQRSWVIGLAICLSLFTCSFSFDRHGVHWAWSERPVVALALAVVAVGLWTHYFRLRRHLRHTGL
jgi:hypothetical protein